MNNLWSVHPSVFPSHVSSHSARKLSAETCFASKTCNSLENIGYKALLLNYCVMMLTSMAVASSRGDQSPTKNKSPTTGCLST